MRMMRIVCISDTHGRHEGVDIPDGDLLIHAGDLTMAGREREVADFNAWLGKLRHRHKIVIAGNHDWIFEREPARARRLLTGCVYLEDSETVVEGIRVYGSPWQPEFCDWAFNLPRGRALKAKWDLIPAGVDILVTHGPPLGRLDLVERGERVGCADLLAAVERIKPTLHVFGHIHEAAGMKPGFPTTFINACVLNARYDVAHPARVFDVFPRSQPDP